MVTAACIFFRRRAMGAASSRPSLRPRFREGGFDDYHSGMSCREDAYAHLVVIPAKAGIQYAAALRVEPKRWWNTGCPPSRA
ncbi:hypothetical protein BRAS3843_970037 [Bradyrhizobium sp. STM 3843]|nr:hypothetical protein BRAS3843_970037 [Bradyrhizobium sp. STM 3843]